MPFDKQNGRVRLRWFCAAADPSTLYPACGLQKLSTFMNKHCRQHSSGNFRVDFLHHPLLTIAHLPIFLPCSCSCKHRFKYPTLTDEGNRHDACPTLLPYIPPPTPCSPLIKKPGTTKVYHNHHGHEAWQVQPRHRLPIACPPPSRPPCSCPAILLATKRKDPIWGWLYGECRGEFRALTMMRRHRITDALPSTAR